MLFNLKRCMLRSLWNIADPPECGEAFGTRILIPLLCVPLL